MPTTKWTTLYAQLSVVRTVCNRSPEVLLSGAFPEGYLVWTTVLCPAYASAKDTNVLTKRTTGGLIAAAWGLQPIYMTSGNFWATGAVRWSWGRRTWQVNIGALCNGSTNGFDPGRVGSNPAAPVIK